MREKKAEEERIKAILAKTEETSKQMKEAAEKLKATEVTLLDLKEDMDDMQ